MTRLRREREHPRRVAALDDADFRRALRVSVLRATAIVTVLGLLFAFAPLGRHLNLGVVLELVLTVTLLVVAVVLELIAVSRARYPVLRAAEAVVVILPLTLLPFAAGYYVLSNEVDGSFNEALTRLDALYFTITTFATVGYGDIVAKSEPARLVVTVQMVVNLVLIGAVARLLFGTAQRRREHLGRTGPAGTGGDPGERPDG